MDPEYQPLEVDRALRQAHAVWLAWKLRGRGTSDAPEEGPALAAYRSVTGLSAFRAIGELPESDPLRGPLRRWVYRLAEQRIDEGALDALGRARSAEHRHPEVPGAQPVSFASLLKRALADAPRRDLWTRLLLEQAGPVSAHAVQLWQRRREVAQRMGLAHPGQIEAALPDTPALARALAAATRERVGELGLGSLSAYFERALGADVPGQWPARLTPRRLFEFFREGDLLRSLSLATAPMPASLGASSLCRALGQLGAAWYEALAPRDQPFVVAHDPYGLGRHQAAACFALLPFNPRFARRYLELSPLAFLDVRRRLGQIALLDLATFALRVRLRPHALEGERAFREAFVELASEGLTLSLPRTAAGALFPLGIEDEQALLGRLLAVSRVEALIEEHDEDWFRNPRAIEQLRAEAQRPPTPHAEPEQARRALASTTRWLEQLLR